MIAYKVTAYWLKNDDCNLMKLNSYPCDETYYVSKDLAEEAISSIETVTGTGIINVTDIDAIEIIGEESK